MPAVDGEIGFLLLQNHSSAACALFMLSVAFLKMSPSNFSFIHEFLLRPLVWERLILAVLPLIRAKHHLKGPLSRIQRDILNIIGL